MAKPARRDQRLVVEDLRYSRRMAMLAVAGFAAVFILDVATPLGLAVGVLYVIPIFAAANPRLAYALAAAAAALTVAVVAFKYEPSTDWRALANRGISLVAIVIACILTAQRARMEARRVESIRMLRQKNRELEHFTYIASHDLQEPVRSIRSYIDLLMNRYADKLDDVGLKSLGFINTAAKRSESLISSLLAYTRLGRDSHATKISLDTLLRFVLADLAPDIRATKAQISTDNLPTIIGFNYELRLLFHGLLANSLQYRDPERRPEIGIRCSRIEGGWWFMVKDNGVGIAEKDHERVFSIFGRLQTTEETENLGIGLANCKRVVELHGGEIDLESAPGEGAAFHFTLMEAPFDAEDVRQGDPR